MYLANFTCGQSNLMLGSSPKTNIVDTTGFFDSKYFEKFSEYSKPHEIYLKILRQNETELASYARHVRIGLNDKDRNLNEFFVKLIVNEINKLKFTYKVFAIKSFIINSTFDFVQDSLEDIKESHRKAIEIIVKTHDLLFLKGYLFGMSNLNTMYIPKEIIYLITTATLNLDLFNFDKCKTAMIKENLRKIEYIKKKYTV